MKFIKKHAFLVVMVVLIALFILMAYLLKDSSKTASVGSDMDSWYSDTKTGGYVVTVYARTGCGWCTRFKPVMEEVQSENGFKLYWFEVDTLNQKDYNTLMNTYDTSNFTGTPYTMVTNNGQLVTYQSGYTEKEGLVEFLKTAGVIK